VFEKLFDSKVKYWQQPLKNPFSSVTNYVDDAKKTATDSGPWCCANTHFYGI